MIQIDWSKAPEGATHCLAWKSDKYGGFYIDNGGDRLMNADLSGGYVMRQDLHLWNVVQRPSHALSCEWLPPVGEVCEARFCMKAVGVDRQSEWLKITPVAYGKTHIIYDSEGKEWSAYLVGAEFRPARTSEQIAADEREATILKMQKIVDAALQKNPMGGAGVAALYDAGLRFTEPKP